MASSLWAQKYSDKSDHFRSVSGDEPCGCKMGLFQTVLKNLLVTEEVKMGFHKRLARFYATETENMGELVRLYPYHLLKAGQHAELVRFLVKDKRSMLTPIHLRREYFLVCSYVRSTIWTEYSKIGLISQEAT